MTTTATVFHAMNTRDSMFYGDNDIYNRDMAIEAFKSGGYVQVGQFQVDDASIHSLEAVYASTQNIHSNWNKDKPCRSTSMGDVVQIDGNLYIVASCGFEHLSDTNFELTLMKNVL